jgi:hypothetical protein
MTKDEKIKELELEVARLNGVIEGMKANPYYLYPRPTTAPYTPPLHPANPWWQQQVYCITPTTGTN